MHWAENLISHPITMWRVIWMLFYRDLHARRRELLPPENPNLRLINGHVMHDKVSLLLLPSAYHQFHVERFEG